MPENVAIYCRLSYAPDGSLEKVERQEADCRQLADRLAWPISEQHVYKDNSRSAWQRKRKRPAWDTMLKAIERREIDAILVYHGDRLIRQPWDLELLLKLSDEYQLHLASPQGVRNLSNEDDRFILRVEAAQACRASADTSRRVKRGWKARAEKGLPSGGGKRPFGFEPDRTTRRESEVEVTREAVAQLRAGRSQGGVIRWLNSVSTTTEGNPWTSRNFHQLLASPRVAGLVANGGQMHKAAWEPIITEEVWEDVKLILRKQAEEFPYPGRERRWLLAGVATCYSCKTPATTKPSGGRNQKNARLYYCKNPQCEDRVARNQAHLDRYVEGRVLRRLQDPDLMDQVLAPDPSVAPQIAALERRKQELKASFAQLADHPDLDPMVMADQLTQLSQKVSALRTRHAETSRQHLLARMAGITQEQWEGTPIDVRSDTVRALFRVVILPATWHGPGFDPASVRLEPV